MIKSLTTVSPVTIIISDQLYPDILYADEEGHLCSIDITSLELKTLFDFGKTITSIIFLKSSTLIISLISGDIISFDLSTSNIINKISLTKPILKISLRKVETSNSVIPPLLTIVYKNEENVDIYNMNDWKIFLHIPANINSSSNNKESQNRKYVTFEWVNTFPELLSFIISSYFYIYIIYSNRSDGVIYTYNILPEWRNRLISPEYQLNIQTRPIFIIHPIQFIEDGSIYIFKYYLFIVKYNMMVSISMDRTVCIYNMSNYALLYKYTTIGCYTLSIDYNPLIDVFFFYYYY